MTEIKGPSLFLAQFIEDKAPFNSLEGFAKWASGLGYKALQLPTHIPTIFDLHQAAHSLDYCIQVRTLLARYGLEISELSTHIQGQLVAVAPCYVEMFAGFYPKSLGCDPQVVSNWASEQLLLAAQASKNLQLTSHVTFSGALLWPMVYPWPQRPKGLIEQGFSELARRWLPILDAFDDVNVDVCYELHPAEDLHDGASFDTFLSAVDYHPRANILYDPSHLLLQQIDYLAFIDIYHERIKAFHVKDAEYCMNGHSGVYGGYLDWKDRAGRFRSLGDGQINFTAIFSKLTQYGFRGWAVLEWECCIKDPQVGAMQGAQIIKNLIIPPTTKAFDDFASSISCEETNKRILGLVEGVL
ncbi:MULTISPECIES: sugar phosphate isomerase/epimerase family protein [Pseudoalteromonas]|uniref:AP endonuclease n=1 Tax=Pseudoalteromonas amylolytica TaxID=1859457 RepID=A0A1S1N0D9_9GAMM|nr:MULTISPECIES: sugar phosphate isomerase/epimerase [Pseudoalteromonas]OHU90559.1 AP endonuclease [Pseudoalteromonas sp. JW3]OHU92819.1 AP endonuclease [Pseudoalteromonas amylolytica]